MKTQWDSLTKDLNALMEDVGNILNGLRPGKDVAKLEKTFISRCSTICKKIDEFDQFMEGKPALSIEYPFDSGEFKTAWEYYKYYLEEVHHFRMESTVENKRLTMLYRLSGKNEQKAVDMLDFLISSRYKSLFKPSDKQLTGEEPATVIESSVPFSLKKETQL
ncbi:MAG: hypothetical protein FWF54_07360 [Candidatus Azobacteroides sp.]|nr:hypothetical protein [Candidatus Azobacteroides sp.]